MSAAPVRAFLDLRAGDPEQHAVLQRRYEATAAHLSKVASSYGWEEDITPEQLDEEARDIVLGSEPSLAPTMLFKQPPALELGRLTLALDSSPGLKRTRDNFIALLTGSKGASKADRAKMLHYRGCPVHRLESGFVLQAGDVTRGDGSGGEAAIGAGGTIKAEPEGLSRTPQYGSLCMASGACKDAISSQFFIVLATEPAQLAKLGPKKYVCFGDVVLDQATAEGRQGAAVLDRLSTYATPSGTPTEPVWIEDCGVLAPA